MKALRTIKQHIKGFTIAELLVVISVIGILAAIVVVTYPGYQKRTRDSERKSDMSQIAAALGAYALQKNNYVSTGSGCGLNGNGNGWFNAGPAEIAAYPKAIATCLQEAGLLNNGAFVDPLNCKWNSGGVCGTAGQPAQAYMKATCTKSGNAVTYVLTHLENDPRKDAEVDALCDGGSVSGFDATTQKWGTNYAMNYYVSAK
jgi:prepilin-type N-terminal cleavage/methylation domain-containing protein